MEIGVEHDQQCQRDTGKQRHIERQFAAPELVHRLQRMGGEDQRAIGADRGHDGIVGLAVDIGLDRAGAIAEATDGRDFRKQAGEHEANLTGRARRRAEHAAGRIDQQHEGPVGQVFRRQVGKQRLFGALTIAGGKHLRMGRERGLRGGRDQRCGLPDRCFHPAMLGQDADEARQRDDGQESDDQDRYGSPQQGLDGTRRPAAILPQGRRRPEQPPAELFEHCRNTRKFDAQPIIGCGNPPRVQHRPCLYPSCDSLRRSPEPSPRNHARFGLSRPGG